MAARSLSSKSNGSSNSTHSNYSSHTQSTAPTIYSHRRPVVRHYDTCPAPSNNEPLKRDVYTDPKASIATYASTAPSVEDLPAQPRYEVPTDRHKIFPSDIIPSTPPDFAELFPSSRRLLIRHDDSTSDGNMNLRVDTEISTLRGRRIKMTLFYLQMQDLSQRQLSLRRYCRDSGREVCHSAKRYLKPTTRTTPPTSKRPVIHRSLADAFQAFTKKTAHRHHDSERKSDKPDNVLGHFIAFSEVKAVVPTRSIRLEFSNYAQVEVHPRRAKAGKLYEFEYWGTQYHWRRSVSYDGQRRLVSYALVDLNSRSIVAEIDPDTLSERESLEEESQGAWIPPCSMKIVDRSVSDEKKTDLADVIVSTGLITLVDDNIKRQWHSTRSICIEHVPTRKDAADYFTPDHLVDSTFHQRSRGTHLSRAHQKA